MLVGKQFNVTPSVRRLILKRVKATFTLFLLLVALCGSTLPVATRDDNLAMGNPSGAVPLLSSPENYLIEKPQYALSYNAKKGIANWVSWHLSAAWKGDCKRKDYFVADKAVPKQWYRVTKDDYTNSGFDRGHLCPSDDRDANRQDNAATFHMTNIVPQSPACNRQTWRMLEEYCRQLVAEGNELYIIAGPHGRSGQGSHGQASSIASGKVEVPRYIWKVILILPLGTNDVKRVNYSTRVIAVRMPNSDDVKQKSWFEYRVTVDELEKLTGYDFFSSVPDEIERVIEARIDSAGV